MSLRCTYVISVLQVVCSCRKQLTIALFQHLQGISKLMFDLLSTPLMKASHVNFINCSKSLPQTERAPQLLQWYLTLKNLVFLEAFSCPTSCVWVGRLGSQAHGTCCWEVQSDLTEEYWCSDSYHLLCIIWGALRLGNEGEKRGGRDLVLIGPTMYRIGPTRILF